MYSSKYDQNEDRKHAVHLRVFLYLFTTHAESMVPTPNNLYCNNLNTDNFLANNDINITASCFHVNFANDNLFSVHAAPAFWVFLLGKEASPKVITAKPYVAASYGATTCVRIAFKAFEMQLNYDFGGVDCTKGVLANSQKEKFDKMKK